MDCLLLLGLLVVLGVNPNLLRNRGLKTLKIECVWVYMMFVLMLRSSVVLMLAVVGVLVVGLVELWCHRWLLS